MLHLIFQRHHIPPHVVYGWERGWKRFAFASMARQIADEKAEADRIKRERGHR